MSVHVNERDSGMCTRGCARAQERVHGHTVCPVYPVEKQHLSFASLSSLACLLLLCSAAYSSRLLLLLHHHLNVYLFPFFLSSSSSSLDSLP